MFNSQLMKVDPNYVIRYSPVSQISVADCEVIILQLRGKWWGSKTVVDWLLTEPKIQLQRTCDWLIAGEVGQC
jgi:hypothetical protein